MQKHRRYKTPSTSALMSDCAAGIISGKSLAYAYKLTFLLFALILTNTNYAAIPFLPQQAQSEDGATKGTYPSLAPMLKKVSSSVVNISTFTKRAQNNNPLFNDPFFRHFFNIPDNYQHQQPKQKRSRAAGSGVIIDAKKGIVITNHHVIDGADEIEVGLLDGRNFTAELLGSDPEVDLAVLKIKAKDLIDIPLANSDELRVGDYVAAIGNPFGLGQTVTTGIVSALGRSGLGLEGYENFIQTDASINPGNSGGALVSLKGELIGINTAIIAPAGGNVGIGFAIPMNMARSVTDQILEHGEVQRGQLGIIIQDLSSDLAAAFKLDKNQKGVLVSEVREGSPAQASGIKAGDIIIGIDKKVITNTSELRNNIGLRRIGEKVDVILIRDTKEKTIKVTIGESSKVWSTAGKPKNNPMPDKRLSGATFSNTKENKGVLVSNIEPNSEASYAGLRVNDVIIMVNHQKVSNIKEFKKEIEQTGEQLLLRIIRGGAAFYLVIR